MTPPVTPQRVMLDLGCSTRQGGCQVTAPTPELDRAIIRRALDAVESFDDDDSLNSAQHRAIESLRTALTAAGYLKGGDRG